VWEVKCLQGWTKKLGKRDGWSEAKNVGRGVPVVLPLAYLSPYPCCASFLTPHTGPLGQDRGAALLMVDRAPHADSSPLPPLYMSPPLSMLHRRLRPARPLRIRHTSGPDNTASRSQGGAGRQAAGLELNARGGIVVDDNMRTSDPAIWAVGDAVEVANPVLGGRSPLPPRVTPSPPPTQLTLRRRRVRE
jgi:hypothetical protein